MESEKDEEIKKLKEELGLAKSIIAEDNKIFFFLSYWKRQTN